MIGAKEAYSKLTTDSENTLRPSRRRGVGEGVQPSTGVVRGAEGPIDHRVPYCYYWSHICHCFNTYYLFCFILWSRPRLSLSCQETVALSQSRSCVMQSARYREDEEIRVSEGRGTRERGQQHMQKTIFLFFTFLAARISENMRATCKKDPPPSCLLIEIRNNYQPNEDSKLQNPPQN